ncbi:MAG: signal peptidase II [Clostridia bacterium]|nr:signal peptidase II [Clostridia bacterium]
MNENTTKKTRRIPWLWLLLSLGVIAIDQITKWLCIAYLKGIDAVTLIPGFLRLNYVENRGAAFGSFSDNRWVFMIISTVAIIGVTVYLLGFCEENRLLRAALALIIGGGIGNMIDRIALGYVVDFIDFYGIWDYVFNGADSAVCIGAGMMLLYVVLEIVKEYKQKKQPADQSTDTAAPTDDNSEDHESN